MPLACLFVFAYLLGSIPFGVLAARLYGVDVRKVGSGNIGATNVKRAIEGAGGPGVAWMIVVFLLDLGKGFAPTFAARQFDAREWMWYLVGIAAVLGHCFSPWLRFRGGKGIATSLGMVFGASPAVAACGFGVFLMLFSITRFVSLSSIVAVFCAAVAGLIFGDWVYVGVGTAIFLFVIYTHRANIARLRNGTEPRFSLRSGSSPDDPGSLSNDPVGTSDDPVGTSDDPGSLSNDPTGTSDDSVSNSNDPVSTSNDPVSTSNDPANPSDDKPGSNWRSSP